jgi:hypothetical protein
MHIWKTTETKKPLLSTTVMALPTPKTLEEWRNHEAKCYPRGIWVPLEPFFLSHGYALWQPPFSLYPMPPNDAPRAPDGFAYRTVYCEIKPNVRHFGRSDMIVSQTPWPDLNICFSESDLILNLPTQEHYSLSSAHYRQSRRPDPPDGYW